MDRRRSARARRPGPGTGVLRRGEMETASRTRTPRWALAGLLLLAVAAVAVPLDRAGQIPGKVPLHVEVLPADGKQRGVVFLIAGGPGQAATQLFDFGEPLIGVLFRTAFPGYTLVAYDVRGTGRSGALH